MLKMLWKDEEGLTTVEYILLFALVVILAVAAWSMLGGGPVGKANTTLPAP